MELYVNGSKLSAELENEKTIGDVLKSFEQECAKTSATTISIVIDGNPISAEDFEAVASQEIKDSTKIELGVVSQAAIEASFEEEKNMCLKISEDLKQISVQFQSGQDREANKTITVLADLIDNICHTASLSALFPEKFGAIRINGQSFQDFFSEFSGTFKDLEEAIKANDTVLVGDLSEYEISPRLLQIAQALEV